jgi:amidase
MEHFKQETFDEAQASADITDPSCVAARASATAVAQTAIDSVLAAHDLDAIIAPTGEPAWLTDPVNGDTYIGPYTAPPAAIAGYPTITIPVGYISGLPVGISFLGGDRSEPELLALAYALEQAIDVRVPPTFPDSVVFEGFVPPPPSPGTEPPADSPAPSASPAS